MREFLIGAAALKTPTRNGSNAQGVNLTFPACAQAYETELLTQQEPLSPTDIFSSG